MTFSSEVKEGRYTYKVINNGTVTFHYIIPALTTPFEMYSAGNGSWKQIDGEVYLGKAKQEYVVHFEAQGKEIQDRIVPIYLMTTDFMRVRDPAEDLSTSNPALIAKGSVSIYLPGAR